MSDGSGRLGGADVAITEAPSFPMDWRQRAWMRIAPRIVSVLLATMIWRQLPLSGLWLVGTLVGVQLAFAGMIALTGGAPRAS